MLKSMTGFGRVICQLPEKKIIIEIKTLNSKQNDINTRLSGYYKEKEIEIRELISKSLGRGKIDFSLIVESTGNSRKAEMDKDLARIYLKDLTELATEFNVIDKSDILNALMQMPELFRVQNQELKEEDWLPVLNAIKEVLNQVNDYRKNEAIALEEDLKIRVQSITDLQAQITPFEEERIKIIKNRIQKNLSQLSNIETNKDRLEQELIYYLEKLDITEEHVRLSKHCTYFIETMQTKTASHSKKLGFIAQEMGREINTIGSKANHAEIQQLVVQMKNELEKIKEQLANIL